MNKIGQANVAMLIGLGIAFVTFAVATSTGAQVINKIETQLEVRNVNSTSYNATINANKGIEELTSWSETIATVTAAAVILSLIGLFAIATR